MEDSERHIVWLNPKPKHSGVGAFLRKRWVRRSIYALVTTFLLLVGSGLIIAYCYEDELKEMALNEVRANLETEMHVGEIELSFWKRFPHISLNLSNIVIEETFETKDTLLFAEDLFLEFNLFDVLAGDYVVKEVSLENAIVHLKRDNAGNDNFHFWKVSDGGSDSLVFSIDEVMIENCEFIYDDLKSSVYVKTQSEELVFRGDFQSDQFALDVEAKMLVKELRVESLSYLHNQQLSSTFVMNIDLEEKIYLFQDMETELEGIEFQTNATIAETANGVLLKLESTGESLDLETLMAQLPDHIGSSLKGYGTSGDLDMTATITGLAGGENTPDVLVKFNVAGGEFLHHGSGMSIKRIDSQGRFERIKDQLDLLSISSCKARLEGGSFSVSGTIRGFDHSDWDLSVAGNFNLDDIRKFAELDLMDELDGLVAANIHYRGSFAHLGNIRAKDLKNAKISGQIELENASFKLRGAPHTFEDIDGLLELQNSDIAIRHFKGLVKGSDFQMTGHFRNVIPYLLLEEETLTLDASFHSSLLDFTPLLQETGSGSGDYHLSFPKNIHFSLALSINHLRFRKFNALAFKGRAEMQNQILRFDDLSFNTSDGSFSASGSVDGRNAEGFVMTCDAQMENIDVNKLFAEFEDFGQSFIKQEHLKGTAYADIHFRAWMDSSLNFDPRKIYSQIDIALENGELIELRSMKNIASYIRSSKLIAPFVNEDLLEEKLNHIYFSRVENKIEIKDGMIRVPNMTISSSAMDISAQGTHSFDNNIDYTIGFKVRDILCKGNESEFGTVEDDGLGNSFFLSMQGSSESPEFGYDRLAHKEKRITDRQKEKEVFKDLLKDELPIFGKKDKKKDTADPDKKEGGVVISIDDDTEDKPKKKRRLKNLFDTEEEDGEVVITIDDDE